MPGSAARLATLLRVVLIALAPAAAARARPVGPADSPVGAAPATGLWPRARHRREGDTEAGDR
ncbi:hypothetical protein [Streptomyces sp. NRRL F-4474]|uniref:hypothetical protein n=1 Tax=Streptomyces sp. NRRL F-4474 TaxID=1463851 RepID=UPI0004C6F539|nr:hypothetical protein [Streptomyces sp. NRRL F-4474]